MGYYSDVAISMFKKDFDNLVVKAKKSDAETEALSLLKHAKILMESPSSEKDDPIVVLQWYATKWYYRFKDVQCIMSYLRDNYINYYFVRCGEEQGDIESFGEPDPGYRLECALYIVTSIDVNVSSPKSVNLDAYEVDDEEDCENQIDFNDIMSEGTAS